MKNNKKEIKPIDVAQWMHEYINKNKELYHEDVVYKIEEKYGSGFVRYNQQGNMVLNKEVLKEFRKLTEPDIVWSRSELYWRLRNKDDPKKGRIVE